jgi:type I restriction enzyme S subunit
MQTASTNIRNIKASEYLKVPVPLPPLDEQVRIVEILEDHLSRLDAADSSLTSAHLRLSVLHKSVLMSLIPDVSVYPANWSRSTVSDAGKVTLGRQRHPDWHNGANMHPYLRVANVFEDRIDLRDVKEMHWPDDSFERFRLKPGDVLLNEGQSPEFLGRPAMYRGEPIDIAFTNTLIRFQANDHVLPEFALLVFRRHMHAGRFARESRITTNIAHLSASRLKPIEFPIPPLDEQKRLAGLAEQQLGDAARLGDQVGLLKLRNKVLRRALLGAAFSGRLTGRTTDMEIVEEMAGV